MPSISAAPIWLVRNGPRQRYCSRGQTKLDVPIDIDEGLRRDAMPGAIFVACDDPIFLCVLHAERRRNTMVASARTRILPYIRAKRVTSAAFCVSTSPTTPAMAQTASEPIATAAMPHLKKSSGLMFAGAGIWGGCQRSQKAGENMVGIPQLQRDVSQT
jgi:hypothetical protein